VGSRCVKRLPADTRAAVIDAIVKAMSQAYFGIIAAWSMGGYEPVFKTREFFFLWQVVLDCI